MISPIKHCQYTETKDASVVKNSFFTKRNQTEVHNPQGYNSNPKDNQSISIRSNRMSNPKNDYQETDRVRTMKINA